MYTAAFRRRRLIVDIAVNGEEAIEKLTHTKYDLALIDIMMPGMSGNDVIRKLQELNNEIKIIIFSNLTKNDVPADVCTSAIKFIVKADTTPPDLAVALDKLAAEI